MAKRLDFITIRVAAFLIITAWAIYFTDSILWGLSAGVILFIGFNFIYGYYDKKKRPYTSAQLSFYLAICDNTTDLICSLLPEESNYIKENNIIITRSGELIYISFGFSPFGMSDILKAIKAAKSHNSSILTIITSDIDRRIFSITSRSQIPINIINSNKLLKLMIKNNSVPDIRNSPRNKITFSEIFTHQAAGRFLLTGSIIALMSIVMPIKLYYLIVSLICFILGLICLINPKKNIENKSILK